MLVWCLPWRHVRKSQLKAHSQTLYIEEYAQAIPVSPVLSTRTWEYFITWVGLHTWNHNGLQEKVQWKLPYWYAHGGKFAEISEDFQACEQEETGPSISKPRRVEKCIRQFCPNLRETEYRHPRTEAKLHLHGTYISCFNEIAKLLPPNHRNLPIYWGKILIFQGHKQATLEKRHPPQLVKD